MRIRSFPGAVALALVALAPAAAADPVTDAFNEAVAAAQGAVVLAGETSVAALGMAAEAPQPAVDEAKHHLANAARVPRAAGEFAMTRLSGLDDLDGPILQDFAATVSPHIAATQGALVVTTAVAVPIGGLPSASVDPVLNYELAAPVDAAMDLQGWGDRSLEVAQAWAAREAAAASGFAEDLAGILTS